MQTTANHISNTDQSQFQQTQAEETMQFTSDDVYDIIVIGAGPAGLCFVNALQGSGLRIALVEMQPAEKLANPAFDGREIALTHPSVAALKKLGVWSHIPADQVYRLKEAKVFDGHSPQALHFKPPSRANGVATDRLGFFVSNHLIRKAAYLAACQGYSAAAGQPESYTKEYAAKKHAAKHAKTAATNDHLHWFTSTRIEKIDLARHAANAPVSVTTHTGEKLHGKLLVAADSRFSSIRSQMGISSERLDFGHSALVFRITHTQSNQETASETFAYGRTLAVLPLSAHMSNCVITAPTDSINQLMQQPDDQLLQETNQILQGRLGQLALASTRHGYPLVAVHAKRFVTEKAALIGDAAVGMHPVTAHGFNLGLHSATTLAGLIKQQAGAGQSISSMAVLQQYERQHMLKSKPLYHGTNAIVSLFTTQNPAAKLLRKAVLFGSDKLPPLKMLITKQLTG